MKSPSFSIPVPTEGDFPSKRREGISPMEEAEDLSSRKGREGTLTAPPNLFHGTDREELGPSTIPGPIHTEETGNVIREPPLVLVKVSSSTCIKHSWSHCKINKTRTENLSPSHAHSRGPSPLTLLYVLQNILKRPEYLCTSGLFYQSPDVTSICGTTQPAQKRFISTRLLQVQPCRERRWILHLRLLDDLTSHRQPLRNRNSPINKPLAHFATNSKGTLRTLYSKPTATPLPACTASLCEKQATEANIRHPHTAPPDQRTLTLTLAQFWALNRGGRWFW